MSTIRFYCEKCGKNVKPKDKICPSCGGFFSQVRCPQCSFQGDVQDFMQGCPICGYAGRTNNSPVDTNGFEEIILSENYSPLIKKGKNRQIHLIGKVNPLLIGIFLGILTFILLVWYYISEIRGGI
jgi:hypothetical protein